LVSEEKKRRIKLSAVFGAITGTALAVVLYLVTTPNPMYFILIPIAAGMAVGQAYMMPEPE
jgi:hypothetical protein